MNLETLRELERKWEASAQALAEEIGLQSDSDAGQTFAWHLRRRMDTIDRCREELSRALAQLDDGWQKDAGRLDWMDDINRRGWAPAIVNDDGGHYAFSDSGMSPVPEEGGHKEPVSITAFVEPHMWRGTIREAIDAAMAEDDAARPLPSPPAQEPT